ncbi:hypothetical protein F5Y15DRAFT_239247 [Xylariaceae sp. FL0016]|nr:hypothetical protein F5Y15DRAFT_239247 [Xylariaceae sp. FL0016]
MTDWKGIVKHGWHPEKEGSTLKGQVKGLIGRGDSSSSSSQSHSATPITSLRDPSSFGPPPKHVGYNGAAPKAGSPTAATISTTTSSIPTQTQSQSQPPSTNQVKPYVAPHATSTSTPVQSQSITARQPPTEAAPEPKPYRVDTSGLSTTHLPPPPMRRDGADGRTVTDAPPAYAPTIHTSIPPKKAPPALPPRLPPRGGNSSPVMKQSPTSSMSRVSRGAPNDAGLSTNESVHLNRGAMERLGNAGISVPGLGIGGPGQVSRPSPDRTEPPTSHGTHGSTGELAAEVKHKQAPPPPRKKIDPARSQTRNLGPPPVPLATKPPRH